MKHIIHTPTEQFGYVETEFDTASITPEFGFAGIASIHNEAVSAVKGEAGEGIDNRDFLAILDELYATQKISGDPGIVESMSKSQQEILRAFKIVIKRAKEN